jgi:hypothetical protein
MRLQRLALVGVAVCLAVGAFGGVAAANGVTNDTTVGADTGITVGDNGGDGGFVCTGTVTDHDCDKEGHVDAGPASVEYDGFNDDSLAERESAFGDTFVITADGEGVLVGFECTIGTEPPEGNPCPVVAEQYQGEEGTEQGDDGTGTGNGDNGQGDEHNEAPDHSNRP